MVASEPTILFSFFAGLVSFLSPCMLPVIPAFISHMAGTNLEGDLERKKIFLTALLFVLGFSTVFGMLGVAINSFLEEIGSMVLTYLSIVAGSLIVIFGLHLSEIVEIDLFERDYGAGLDTDISSGYISSFLLGGAFAVGWTPCVGPILGSIFALASASPGSAFIFLTAYSIGIGTPFLLVGLFPRRFIDKVRNNMQTVRKVRIVFGYVMIVLGLLIMTQKLELIANFEILNQVIL